MEGMSPSPSHPLRRPLAVGDIVHGFAYGAFGRDHNTCVLIEAVGPDWIVARSPEAVTEWHGPSFASGRSSLERALQARDEPCPADSPCPTLEWRQQLSVWPTGAEIRRAVRAEILRVSTENGM